MKRTKRLAALVLSAALCAGMLAGCGKTERSSVLSVCAGDDVTTFDPAYVSTAADNTVLGSLYEGLMRVSGGADGASSAVEGMAKKVTVEENFDGTTTYTFHLRSARWSDGRSVTAQDFVYAWQRLANPLTLSPNAPLLSVVQGYDAVRAGAELSELAVSAKNDSTLEVVLSGKYDWFLSEICTSPALSPLRQDVVQTLKEAAQDASAQDGPDAAPRKWWSDPTKLVTNGAYTAAAYEPGESLELAPSERYYGHVANDGVRFAFAADADEAWALYSGGAVDFTYALPDDQLAQQAQDEQHPLTPELSVCTVLFNGAQLPTSDPSVRRALTLAVDRQSIAALAGGAAQAAQGLVPFGVSGGDGGEDFRTEGGDLLSTAAEDLEPNRAQARELLAGSDYEDRYDLEYLYVDEGPAAQIAAALAEQWQSVLNVRVRTRAVTEPELYTALRAGEYDLACVDWSVLFGDAEAFLAPFVSRSGQDVVVYENGAYDTLLRIIDSASDPAARLACLHDAEALLLEDAAVCPLYFTGTAWKLREGWSGLCRDARGWFSFMGVAAVSS